MHRRTRRGIALASLGIGLVVAAAIATRYEWLEKRVRVIATTPEGTTQLVRGAWQRPLPLRRIINREGIETILSLTAINSHDPKYVDQERVVEASGVEWILIPMRGSTATLEQLAEASDVLADPARRPVFFHCVAGHHRTNLVHAAYLIRHRGWSAERAWAELERLPWTEPAQDSDQRDRALLREFEAWNAAPHGDLEVAAKPIEDHRP